MTGDGLILSAGTLQAVPFLDRLEPARAAGFAGVSIFAADIAALTEAGHSGPDIRARVADAGLAISEVEIVGNWLPGPGRKSVAPWLDALLTDMTPAHLIELAVAVGASGITVGELRGTDSSPDIAVPAFAAICDRAAAQGLTVALEFIPTGAIPSLDAAWAIVRDADCANGGILLDAWHFFRSGSSLSQLASLPPGGVNSIQLCDAPLAPEADLDWAMIHARLLPGKGELDLAGLVTALQACGTTAPVAVEVFSDALAALPAASVARRCAASTHALLGEL